MTPESDLAVIQAETLPKLVRTVFFQSIAMFILAIGVVMSIYLAVNKKPQVLGITESGRVIPIVPLDKPYVGDARIIGFSDECLRQAFSHDFLNFRQTSAAAKTCFTAEGGSSFDAAIEPLLKDLEQRRMVMSTTLQPAVIVKTFKRSGNVHSWIVQSKMTLFREGTKERVVPATYIVDMVIERVALEESVRGISVAQINVRPG